jgi:CBS domain-containing protein
MKHNGTAALIVTDAQTGHPAGIITEADIAHAIADGKDVNDVWVNAVMTTRPVITTTTTNRDAATIMTPGISITCRSPAAPACSEWSTSSTCARH